MLNSSTKIIFKIWKYKGKVTLFMQDIKYSLSCFVPLRLYIYTLWYTRLYRKTQFFGIYSVKDWDQTHQSFQFGKDHPKLAFQSFVAEINKEAWVPPVSPVKCSARLPHGPSGGFVFHLTAKLKVLRCCRKRRFKNRKSKIATDQYSTWPINSQTEDYIDWLFPLISCCDVSITETGHWCCRSDEMRQVSAVFESVVSVVAVVRV